MWNIIHGEEAVSFDQSVDLGSGNRDKAYIGGFRALDVLGLDLHRCEYPGSGPIDFCLVAWFTASKTSGEHV